MALGLSGIISSIIAVGLFSVLQINKIAGLITIDGSTLADESTKLIIVVVLISLVLATIFGLFMTRSIARPLLKLRTAANKMAGGKLDEDFSINSDDEIGELSKTYVEMSNSLKGAINLLSNAEQKYRSLYESSPELYRTISTEGIILDCNESYVNSLGYTKEEIIGCSIFDHAADNSKSDLRDSFETWKKEGHVTSREIWFKKKMEVFSQLFLVQIIYMMKTAS